VDISYFSVSELNFLFVQATQADYKITSLFIISPRLFNQSAKCNKLVFFSFKIKIVVSEVNRDFLTCTESASSRV